MRRADREGTDTRGLGCEVNQPAIYKVQTVHRSQENGIKLARFVVREFDPCSLHRIISAHVLV